MRSIRYLLTKHPCNTNDCLDLIRKGLSARVELQLSATRHCMADTVVVLLLVTLKWWFAKFSLTTQETCASFSILVNDDMVQTLHRANSRLIHLTEQLLNDNVRMEFKGHNLFVLNDLQKGIQK